MQYNVNANLVISSSLNRLLSWEKSQENNSNNTHMASKTVTRNIYADSYCYDLCGYKMFFVMELEKEKPTVCYVCMFRPI